MLVCVTYSNVFYADVDIWRDVSIFGCQNALLMSSWCFLNKRILVIKPQINARHDMGIVSVNDVFLEVTA